jgi:alkylated DNA repair dioxygenase AlkB
MSDTTPFLQDLLKSIDEQKQLTIEKTKHLLSNDVTIEYFGPDSYLISGLFDSNETDNYFNNVLQETHWNTMNHKGGSVPRLVSIQQTKYDTKRPIYRHPTDVQPFPESWNKTSGEINTIVSKLLNADFNHALIQLYRNGKDYIREHADKTLDIKKGTNIVNVSLGRTRNMKLRSKFKMDDGLRLIETISLTHGSIFVLGWETNKLFLHSIKPDKRVDKIKREDELICDGKRISLTLRVIDTFMDLKTEKLFGQGAPSDQENIDDNDCENMLISFGKENKMYDYEWDDLYRSGFHSLNFKELISLSK